MFEQFLQQKSWCMQGTNGMSLRVIQIASQQLTGVSTKSQRMHKQDVQ